MSTGCCVLFSIYWLAFCCFQITLSFMTTVVEFSFLTKHLANCMFYLLKREAFSLWKSLITSEDPVSLALQNHFLTVCCPVTVDFYLTYVVSCTPVGNLISIKLRIAACTSSLPSFLPSLLPSVLPVFLFYFFLSLIKWLISSFKWLRVLSLKYYCASTGSCLYWISILAYLIKLYFTTWM